MNIAVTSKEEILKVCRELVSENGLPSLNMRLVAQKCNVALGSLYNYFPSKNDLIVAVIESVWCDIFHMECKCEAKTSFTDNVQWIFESIKSGMIEYPNFFTTHSLAFADDGKGTAQKTMERYFSHMKEGLLESLEHDGDIREYAFNETFTQTKFIDFVFLGILSLLMQQQPSCNVLLEMILRTLY